MRSLRKAQPPNNVSPAGQQASTWQQAETEFVRRLQTAAEPAVYAREQFDSMDKSALRAVMYREQGSLCVYCERRVVERAPSPRVDHWRPLSANPQLALHWRNLYLSCTTKQTCDQRKGENPLRFGATGPELPWPVDHAYERCVGFTSLGEMYVRSDAPLDNAQRSALIAALGAPHNDTLGDNGVLNLNHPTLVAAREAALDNERQKLERQYRNKSATREEREERRDAMLRECPLPEFVSIRVRWLDVSLGKAR